MADKLWELSRHYPLTSAGVIGGSFTDMDNTHFGGMLDLAFEDSASEFIRYLTTECTVSGAGLSIKGATGTGGVNKSFLEISLSRMFGFTASSDTKDFASGTFECYISVSASAGDNVLFFGEGGSNTHTVDDTAPWYDGAIQGIDMRIVGGTLHVLFGGLSGEAIRDYDTGFVISAASKHFMISVSEDGTQWVIGYDGDTLAIPERIQKAPGAIILGNCWQATQSATTHGCDCVVKDMRFTAVKERYGKLATGLGTYTPDAAGYPDFSAPAAPLTLTHTMGTLADNEVPDGSTTYWEVTNVSGGTPPYTYEWVDLIRGSVGWLYDSVAEYTANSLRLSWKNLNVIDSYTFACIVTDSVGTVATTHDVALQAWWSANSQNEAFLKDTIVDVTVGDDVIIDSRHVNNSTDLWAWGFLPNFPGKSDMVGASGVTNGEAIKSYPSVVYGTDQVDAYRIAPVTEDDDGARIRFRYWGGNDYGAVTLRVRDTTRSGGWWRDLYESRQTVGDSLDSDLYKSFREGYDWFVDYFNNDPNYGSEGWAVIDDAAHGIQYTTNTSGLNQYTLGVYAGGMVLDWLTPWLNYNIAAQFVWDLTDDYNAGQALGVDVAYWHAFNNYPNMGAFVLPSTGTYFGEVFRMAYEATWDGFMHGKMDADNVDPQYTSKSPPDKYLDKYRAEYLSLYDYGYNYGWGAL